MRGITTAMATILINTATNFYRLDISAWTYLIPSTSTATAFAGSYSFDTRYGATFTGTGFTYAVSGEPTGGTVTRFFETFSGAIQYNVAFISVPATTLFAWAKSGQTALALQTVLAGNDLILGSPGPDVLFGGAGDDRLLGADENDVLEGDDGNDSLVGDAGDDTLHGMGGDDQVIGGSGSDMLTGGQGDDSLDGGEGNDSLLGGEGRDRLVGGFGNDIIGGGSGVDTAVYDNPRYADRGTIIGTLRTEMVVTGAAGMDRVTGVEIFEFLDGRLVFDVSDRAAVVYRMYGAAFDRTPDPLGFNGWISALERGATAETIALSFTGSLEVQLTYGNLSNRGFVEQLYRNVLDREGDAGGLADWTGKLDAGTLTRGQVLVGFSESPEHVEKLRPAIERGLWDQDETASAVARLYYASLDRAPDSHGLAFWTRDARFNSLPNIADAFVNSREFNNIYGPLSNEAYVNQLYLNVLDREADEAGLSDWVGALDSRRLDRGDVLHGFAQSLEFQIKTQPFVESGVLLI